MKVEELKEKVYSISTCEFPLDTFLNDVMINTNPRFDKEMALRDIEKIYNTFKYYVDKNENLKRKLAYYVDVNKTLKRKLNALYGRKVYEIK